jgi:hypothetical protein
MTVLNTSSRVSYSGNGTTESFPIPYYFIDDADITVITRDESTGVETTLAPIADYSLSGAGNESGGVLVSTIAIPVGTNITIIRDPELSQETDYTPYDKFPAEDHERALDKLTMLVQRARDSVSRSLRLSDGTTVAVDVVLPTPEPGRLLGWDSFGQSIINFAGTIGVAVSSFMSTVLAAANAATARTALGVAVGSDVDEYKPTATQDEMEYGTEAALRNMSPLLVKQAIDMMEIDGKWIRDYITDEANSFPKKFQPTAAWFELLRLSPSVQSFIDGSSNILMTEQYVREVIDEMATTGVDTVIIPYTEYFGYWFYTPGFAYPTDHDTSSTGQYWHTKLADGRVGNFNPVQVILDQAQRNNMRVFLGLGRNGDTPLLQDLYNVNVLLQADPNRYGLSLATRLTNAINRTRQVAADLISQFGSYRSFYGFYISHEPGHVNSANSYLTPVTGTAGANPALRTHGKPIMAAPGIVIDAAATSTFADTLVASGCDIFAPQDSAGPGTDYDTGYYTFVPQNAINDIAAHQDKWRRAVNIANGKTKLSGRRIDLFVTAEAWEMGEKPVATLTPTGTTGTVTFNASASVFTAGDVGKLIHINGGYATITSQTGTAAVGTVGRNLSNTTAATSGNWAVTVSTNGGYTNDFPAAWSRIQSQLYEIWPRADGVSLYSWFGHIDSGALSLKPSQNRSGKTDYQTRAANLHANLKSHIISQRLKYRELRRPSILSMEHFEIPSQAPGSTVAVDFGTFYPKHDGSTIFVMAFINYHTTIVTGAISTVTVNLKGNGFTIKTATDPSDDGRAGGGIPMFTKQLSKGLSVLWGVELTTSNGNITLQGADLLVLEVV